MKRDMDLVRSILINIEDLPFNGAFHDIAIPGHSEGEITYHVMILDEAGLVEAVNLTTNQGVCWKPLRLTYAGHEFLDAARSDTVWERAKSFTLKTTGALTLEGLKLALPFVVKKLIADAS